MAKQEADRTTLDLFADERRPGRPKTNPLPRQVQLKLNKRNQLKRDRERGLHRIELKVDEQLFSKLNVLANERRLSRAELIQTLLQQQLAQQEQD
ncbi:LexA regulated protein [Oceanimonas baumannii]|uniref:LexA regulated protein n=1 Tax=Oceanimonas baumannii TaxID=129578 RepID=A0A235CEX9_9GAMM|nr:LexA regulated protein [Oceanimonas baumannii]OYD23103.1 LexA regulated protein [Oceanimonas baumannii]TDW58372.1 ribbon-helix-helix CopG family protein [Oceanimonas baumannii]